MLLATLVAAWPGRPEAAAAMIAKPVVSAPKQAPAKQKALEVNPKPAAFRWQQLEAPDFPTFVKNLRAIGCPEATIRDIISGELREIQQTKQQQVAQSPQSRTAGGAASTPRLMQAEFEQLQKEQERQLAVLLGPAAAGTAGAVAASQTPAAGTSTGTSGPAAANPKVAEAAQTPAAFLVNKSTLQATPAQAAALNQMQSDFSNAVQASGQDPSSPAYRMRWDAARHNSDEQFSSLFGGDRFIQTQQQAVRAAAAKP